MSEGPFAAVPLELHPGFHGQLNEFIDLVELWQRRVNLVSRNLGREGLIQHALSSLAVLDPEVLGAVGAAESGRPSGSAEPACPAGLRLLDIGSGGGFPAMVLLMARPAWRGVLVEATGKKCFFLREASERLAPGRVTVLHQRYEEPTEERGSEAEAAAGPFDLVTLRAVRPERRLVSRLRSRLAGELAPGGIVAWYAAQDEAAQAMALDALATIGLEDTRTARITWASATLVVGRKASVSRETHVSQP